MFLSLYAKLNTVAIEADLMGVTLRGKVAAILLLCAGLVAGRPALAQDHWTPADLGHAIEGRATKSSFADLERFGEAASHGDDRESLMRLQHVISVLLNQSEFDRFEHWNAILKRKAAAQGDQRYMDMARINDLEEVYARKGDVAKPALEHIAQTDPDWFARIEAMGVESTILADDNQTGAALKLLSQAEQLIPAGDPASNAAESTVWGRIGLALMDLNDLDGATQAFRRADFEFSNPAYPRPDFDGVYNMAGIALQLGERDLARDLQAVHHRLTLRSDLPHLRIWDQYLCAHVADTFGTSQEVLTCLKGLDRKLTGAEFIAAGILPLRAIAEAREGDLADALADQAALRAISSPRTGQTPNQAATARVDAAILAAQGKPMEAYRLMVGYERDHAQTSARRVDAGVRQLTSNLQTQLATARRDVSLERQAAAAQAWIIAFVVVFLGCAIAAVVWQRRLGKKLQAAQLRAEMASQSKTEFLANMSHEIRTPLNGVVGVADLLAAADLPEREREMVEIIRSSGQSLERLLSDVLDLARVEAGQLTIEPAPFQAGDLVRTVAALLRPRAELKGLLLQTHIAGDMESWFMGDATRVRQILTNLMSNAVKFTDSGTVSITAQKAAGGRLRFEVADTGVGFDDAARGRLFHRFQQADGSITRRFGGSGLGLAISRQLASLMGGDMGCESQPGVGSQFWFEAPFAATLAAERVDDALAAHQPSPDRSVRVLVVDDHDINRKVVSMMLDGFGAETICVGNGLEAVEAVRGGHFDLVFMDMQMPVMDGLEATRTIRREELAAGRRRTRVIMLSANAMPEHAESSRAAGADGHLAKPVTIIALLDALNLALDDEDAAVEPAAAMA